MPNKIKTFIKKQQLNYSLFRLTHIFFKSKIDYCDESVKNARLFLDSLSSDPHNSAICTHKKTIFPTYDLQIIVPAYNVESYIEACLDSILNQKTTYSYKVIVVNDGSTDNTADILNKYLDYKNIEIITQSNRGLSGARNRALETIEAKYILFVDSDDILYPNSIEVLLSTAFSNNADVVEGNHCIFNNNIKEIATQKYDGLVKDSVLCLRGFSWGKVYRSSLFTDVYFPLDYWFEDTINAYLIHSRANKSFVIKDVVYGYRINEKGITYTSKRKFKSIDSLWITEQMIKDMKVLGIPFNQSIYEHTLQQIKRNYKRISNLNDKEIKKAIFILSVDLLYTEFKINHKTSQQNKLLEDILLSLDLGSFNYYVNRLKL